MSISGWPVGIWPAPERPTTSGAPRPRSLRLDRDYANLLPAALSASNEATNASRIRSILHQGESFDVAAALQASRIIASGEDTDRVLTHLMQVIRIQAGAETAQLLILEGGRLRLEASATVESGGVMLFASSEPGQGRSPRPSSTM